MNKFGRVKFAVSLVGIPLCFKTGIWYATFYFVANPDAKVISSGTYSTRLELLIRIFQYTSFSFFKNKSPNN